MTLALKHENNYTSRGRFRTWRANFKRERERIQVVGVAVGGVSVISKKVKESFATRSLADGQVSRIYRCPV